MAELTERRKQQLRVNAKRYYYRHHEQVKEKAREKERARALELRKIIFDHYGHKCSCPGCDVTEYEWLSLDHVNRDGYEMRKNHRHWGIKLYRWIIKNNFPDSFRVLCHNCNLSRGFYGFCPHAPHDKHK